MDYDDHSECRCRGQSCSRLSRSSSCSRLHSDNDSNDGATDAAPDYGRLQHYRSSPVRASYRSPSSSSSPPLLSSGRQADTSFRLTGAVTSEYQTRVVNGQAVALQRPWSSSSTATLVQPDSPPYTTSNCMAEPHQKRFLNPHEDFALSATYTARAYSRPPPSFSPHRHRPLIGLVTNEWKNNPKYRDAPASPDDSFFFEREEWDLRSLRMLLARRIPRRVRRYITIYFTLALVSWFAWKWFLRPGWELRQAIDASLSKEPLQVFGTNMRPAFDGMIHLKELDSDLLPTTKDEKKRLIFIGDVHGCSDELSQLLDRISFRSSTDHLVFVGDLIAKGPDSPGVVDMARKLSASCVRGNHEDRVLLAHAELQERRLPVEEQATPVASANKDGTMSPIESFSHGDERDRDLARKLSTEQIAWLQECPVILKVGNIKGMGDVRVAHAGLVPGVALERQDPFQSMNMRTIDLETRMPSERRDGVAWEKLWNRYQRFIPATERGTVIYGHDSKRGLNIEKFTKGLDSGCVNGGRLTALVVEAGKKKSSDAKQTLVSVKCRNYIKAAEAAAAAAKEDTDTQ